jgi:hypothetical protein
MLADLIYRKLRLDHVGMNHAIKREDLQAYLNRICGDGADYISDRDMRRAIENHLPMVLSGPHGYWLPDPVNQNRDVNKAVGYLTKKIIGLDKRRRAILGAYPEANQGELF